jgi:hypothetical protein
MATKELSRKELKGIMAGSGNSGGGGCPWGCREWEICCGSYNGRHGVKTDHVAINVTIKQ